jgi:uncharacterized membrane protein YjfL (UPF0719 family)
MHLTELAGTLIYSIVGIIIFIISYIIFEKLSPFSIKKEIIEDQNVALGIIMGAVFLGLSIIIASAMH